MKRLHIECGGGEHHYRLTRAEPPRYNTHMRRPRFQFDIGMIFVEIAMIAICLGSLAIAGAIIKDGQPLTRSFGFMLLVVGGASLGTAVGLPFRRGFAGAIIGVVLVLLASVAFLLDFVNAPNDRHFMR